LGHEVWAKARANNDFKSFQSTLERIYDLTIQQAEYLGYKDHPYDALLGLYERGITTAQVKQIFDTHKPQLVELIAAIGKHADRVSDAVLHQSFEIEKQREFALEVVKGFGFDFERGRQDIAVHPFCTHFSRNDVRVTTRFSPDFLNPALFGMMHEAGHGLYELGSDPSLEGSSGAVGRSGRGRSPGYRSSSHRS
jgi:carboxypeptidase Taq